MVVFLRAGWLCVRSVTWKMLAPYGVLHAFSRLSFPVLTNHLPAERADVRRIKPGPVCRDGALVSTPRGDEGVGGGVDSAEENKRFANEGWLLNSEELRGKTAAWIV